MNAIEEYAVNVEEYVRNVGKLCANLIWRMKGLKVSTDVVIERETKGGRENFGVDRKKVWIV